MAGSETDNAHKGRRLDASMTLLNEVRKRPLDPGYAAVAAAKERGDLPRFKLGTKLLVFILALILGAAGAWAAEQLRAPASATPSASSVLAEQLRTRSAETETLSSDISQLQSQINEAQAEGLGPQAETVLGQAQELAVLAGTIAVHGPGIDVTMSDSAQVDEQADPNSENRVQDGDIQMVVNGLWASGAEAISINGHRLTSRTAIRTAGDAILVDLEPIDSPYVISAIGDPNTLRGKFEASAAGAILKLLATQYSISSSIKDVDDLKLPAGSGPLLQKIHETS